MVKLPAGLAAVAVCLTCLATCTDITSDRRGTLLVLRPTATASVAGTSHPRPFVGILDSLSVTVQSPSGARMHFGKHLTSADTLTLTYSLGVLDGRIGIDAQIFNDTGRVLYSGAAAVDVSRGGSVVSVDMPARVPILLVSPDTLRVRTLPRIAVSDSVKVYNRGIGLLDWQAGAMSPPPPSGVRDCTVNCMRLPDSMGIVAAGESTYFHIDSIYDVANPVTVTILSPQGKVRVVVMRRAP